MCRSAGIYQPRDDVHERGARDRLGHDDVIPAPVRRYAKGFGFCGKPDDLGVPIGGIARPEMPDDPVPVDMGHVLVKNHEIEMLHQRRFKRLPPVIRNGQIDRRETAEQRSDDLLRDFIVFRKEYLECHVIYHATFEI